MKFGLALMNDFPPGTVPADRIACIREQVRTASVSGIDSVWVLQHYLGVMPTLQPLPLLAALASEAGDMYLGTNVLILPLRHPVGLAEDLATLDHISGGRAIAGVGLGYREDEFRSFGIPLGERIGRFAESIEVIRSLWSDERTTYRGEYFSLEEQQLSLRPIQVGGPRLWVGAGAHRTGALRAARFGDAWIIQPHVSPDRLRVLVKYYLAERARLNLGLPGELVVRRQMVLDQDRDRARATGIRAHGAVAKKYAAMNRSRDRQAGQDRQVWADAAQRSDGDGAGADIFGDPAMAINSIRALEAQGFTYVILRMQWYDLSQKDMLHTLELFRNYVLPAFDTAP